jgi:hypothetical protein
MIEFEDILSAENIGKTIFHFSDLLILENVLFDLDVVAVCREALQKLLNKFW